MKLLPALSWLTQRQPPDVAGQRARALAAPVPELPVQPKPILLPPPAKAAEPEYGRRDPRHMSPREFGDLTHELYLEGVLSWDEYRMVGFPSELNPRYDETIGALTGEKADPDRPRDMLKGWEQKVDFLRRYSDQPDVVTRAERVLDVLRWQAEPPLDLAV
jgi:hypothetical protein